MVAIHTSYLHTAFILYQTKREIKIQGGISVHIQCQFNTVSVLEKTKYFLRNTSSLNNK